MGSWSEMRTNEPIFIMRPERTDSDQMLITASPCCLCGSSQLYSWSLPPHGSFIRAGGAGHMLLWRAVKFSRAVRLLLSNAWRATISVPHIPSLGTFIALSSMWALSTKECPGNNPSMLRISCFESRVHIEEEGGRYMGSSGVMCWLRQPGFLYMLLIFKLWRKELFD